MAETKERKKSPQSTFTTPAAVKEKKKAREALIMVLTQSINNNHTMYHKMSLLWQELGWAVPQTQKLESKSLKLVMPDCCCSEQEKKRWNKKVEMIS